MISYFKILILYLKSRNHKHFWSIRVIHILWTWYYVWASALWSIWRWYVQINLTNAFDREDFFRILKWLSFRRIFYAPENLDFWLNLTRKKKCIHNATKHTFIICGVCRIRGVQKWKLVQCVVHAVSTVA